MARLCLVILNEKNRAIKIDKFLSRGYRPPLPLTPPVPRVPGRSIVTDTDTILHGRHRHTAHIARKGRRATPAATAPGTTSTVTA